MKPQASLCLGCSALDFPPRLRCHRCGGMQFASRLITSAEVAGVSRVHRGPPGCVHEHLVELWADGGLRLLAVARFAPPLGSRVQPVSADNGAIFISDPEAPEPRNSND